MHLVTRRFRCWSWSGLPGVFFRAQVSGKFSTEAINTEASGYMCSLQLQLSIKDLYARVIRRLILENLRNSASDIEGLTITTLAHPGLIQGLSFLKNGKYTCWCPLTPKRVPQHFPYFFTYHGGWIYGIVIVMIATKHKFSLHCICQVFSNAVGNHDLRYSAVQRPCNRARLISSRLYMLEEKFSRRTT